jgi:hypothetical protein
MDFQSILTALQHKTPIYRRQAAQILGMVQDVDVLESLAAAFKQEKDSLTRPIMKWAGQRLYQARQDGWTSMDVIFEMFALNRELSGLGYAEEERLLQQLQDKLDSDLLQIREQGTRGKLGWTLAAGLAGGIGGMTAGTIGSMMISSSHRSRSDLSDGSGERRQRIPPMAPTNANYDIWANRLTVASEPEQKIAAVREIAGFNNPLALIPIAELYYQGQDEQVKLVAEGSGKHLYWNMRYWELTQDGRIDAEFKRRAEEGEWETPQEHTTTTPAQPTSPTSSEMQRSSPEEIAKILAKAEEKRRRRRR